MAEVAISALIFIVVVVVVCGLLAYLLQSAPFIGEPFKSIGIWAIVAIAIVVVVIKLLELI